MAKTPVRRRDRVWVEGQVQPNGWVEQIDYDSRMVVVRLEMNTDKKTGGGSVTLDLDSFYTRENNIWMFYDG